MHSKCSIVTTHELRLTEVKHIFGDHTFWGTQVTYWAWTSSTNVRNKKKISIFNFIKTKLMCNCGHSTCVYYSTYMYYSTDVQRRLVDQPRQDSSPFGDACPVLTNAVIELKTAPCRKYDVTVRSTCKTVTSTKEFHTFQFSWFEVSSKCTSSQ